MDKIKIKKYLEDNPGAAIDAARELNSWDGSFPEFDTFYLSDLVDCMCCDHKSTLRFLDDVIYAAKSGEFNNFWEDDLVRYNSLNQLEVRTESELEEEVMDYIDEIVDRLEEDYPHVQIYDPDLAEILEEGEE